MNRPRGAIACILFGAAGGCQLKAPPAKPVQEIHASEDISANTQQVRLRMRDLVGQFSGTITESADQIIASTSDRAVKREALLWKIEAVPALRESLFRPNSLTTIIDTWVLTCQMTDYFESGRGSKALAGAAPIAAATTGVWKTSWR